VTAALAPDAKRRAVRKRCREPTFIVEDFQTVLSGLLQTGQVVGSFTGVIIYCPFWMIGSAKP
jgi:hypothetical protein